MPNDNQGQQRLLQQEAYRKRRIDFYRQHGRWPEDWEISEGPATPTGPPDPLERLFAPRG